MIGPRRDRTRWHRGAGRIALASIVAMVALVATSHAQSGGGFEISAQVVAAGQTRANGDGGLSMAATVAQADAANTASGGGYSLRGGYWPVATNPPPADALFGNGFE